MQRPLLSQREAAAACGVSRSTIRRRREAGELPGCVQDEERGWLIPVDALLAAGFRLNAPAPPEDAAVPAAPTGAAAPAEAGGDAAGLRAELERERERQVLLAQVAEARHEAALAAAEVRHLRDQLDARDGHIEDLRAELERKALLIQVTEARHETALAAAEVGRLRVHLAARDEHVEDLRSALRALSSTQNGRASGPWSARRWATA
ncbi:helix-turn-helix transcriptional regulator [Streptomyces filamentosus]|uniref:helix-turn-helix transcriptional regulator n=1 Tax=Streptomyces filamentosus TaxID=67294 RepID=UPI0033213C47